MHPSYRPDAKSNSFTTFFIDIEFDEAARHFRIVKAEVARVLNQNDLFNRCLERRADPSHGLIIPILTFRGWPCTVPQAVVDFEYTLQESPFQSVQQVIDMINAIDQTPVFKKFKN